MPTRIQSLNLKDFKTELKSYLKPHNIKHFRVVNKELNSIFSRFRTGRTGLNADRYSIGQADNPACMCHYKTETSEHFILNCILYSTERQTLFNPIFLQLNRKEKYNILTEGINNQNPEYYNTNVLCSFL